MYDTVNMWLSCIEVGGDPFVVAAYLSDLTERQNKVSGYSCTGNLGNYVVSCYQSGISLKGSLAKFYLPSNLYTLTRRDTQEAIEALSDQLHTDVGQAKVNRLDISTVIPTSRPPSDYYCHLGGKPHFQRLAATDNTLYYLTQRRQLVFYDKRAEATAKGAIVPPTFADCANLLRYELRYVSDLPRQLKQATVTARSLYDCKFYSQVIQRWAREFESIRKNNNPSIMTDGMTKPQRVKEAFFGMLLQQQNDPQQMIDAFIADLKARSQFADPKAYSRLKSDLNKMLQAPMAQPSELISELERAIRDIAKYQR